VLAVRSIGPCFTSDVITFNQNWHYLYSSSAGGTDLSNDTQIRVMGTMNPEICTKMLRKLKAKFPATALSYCMVKIAHLDDASSEILNWKQASRRSITVSKR